MQMPGQRLAMSNDMIVALNAFLWLATSREGFPLAQLLLHLLARAVL